ncbi:hypothetical protein D3C85_1428890 [compost metagenome]
MFDEVDTPFNLDNANSNYSSKGWDFAQWSKELAILIELCFSAENTRAISWVIVVAFIASKGFFNP